MQSNMFTLIRSTEVRTAALAAGVSLTLALAATAVLAGPIVQCECETFVDSHNIGGIRIHEESCSGASEGLAADGVDRVGEWIELLVFTPVTGYYQVTVGYQTEYQEIAGVRMTVLAEGGGDVNRVADFTFLEGWGFG